MAAIWRKLRDRVKAMKPFVMFGTHPLFGDYVDAIHAVGGYLSRVVLNVQEPQRPAGQKFQDRLEKYQSWLRATGCSTQVKVLWLDDYSVDPDETALLGFRGTKAQPLLDLVKERHGVTFPPLVHRSAMVSPMSELHEGVFVGAGSVIAPNCSVGSFSLINRGTTIGHDNLIEPHVVIGPSVQTASSVHIESGAVLGIGCTIREHLVLGAGSYIAAGAVVLKHVEPGHLVAGVPAVSKKVLSG